MSYARRTAMAGAVLLGCALGVRAQEPSTEPKRDDAPPAKSASPSDASKSARSRFQRPGQPGYRSGNDATEPSKQAEKEDPKKEEPKAEGKTKPAEGAEPAAQRREPIDPKARVIQFEFAKQPWDTLLETLAEVAGLSLQMEFKPDGTFSYINDPNKYTLGEAIDVINMQLFTKGYTLIRKGNYLKLWPLSQPIEPAWIPRVKPEELDDYGDSQFVSVTFPIQSISASAAVKEIEGSKGEHGKIVALESSNKVTITDIVANIRLMRDMLKEIEEGGAPMKAKSRTFQLKFVAATKVEATLRDLFGLQPRSALNQPSGRTSGSDRDRGGGDPREIFRRMMEGGGGQPPWMAFGPGGQPGGGQPGGDQRGGEGRDSRGGDRGSDPRFGQQTQPTITLAVDETHNQLFVMAPLEKLAIAEEVIKVMDVPREGSDPYKPPVLQTPVITPYRLSDGDAQSLATALNTIYQTTPGVRISADTGNNMVIVTATPDDQEHIKKLVEQFEYDERNSVVLSLSTLDAGSVETLLTAVYASGQRDWRGNTVPRPGQPKVVADRTRNQLMIRGSKKQIDDIRGMLAALGEPQLMGVAGSNTLQVLRMGSGDQKILMEQLEKFWPVVRPNNNRIEIIDLGKRTRNVAPPAPGSESPEPTDDPRRREPPRRVQPDANDEPSPPPSRIRSKSSGDQQNRTSRDSRTSVKLVSYVAPVDGQPEPDAVTSKPQSQEPRQMPQADQDGPPVVISVGPDGTVVVGSTDPEAMQRFMNLWRTLTGGGAGSGGANYKVFYLDSADATQMQTTLNDLLGVSFSSSFFGGSSSSTATSTLKIVPDARTNSLIVYGSANDLARVEQLIKVLDSSDAPASGAMSSPRIIPVQYANATSVARVIRDVYSSRVTGSSGGFGGFGGSPNFGGGFSPFGSSGGGPGGSGGSSSRSRSSTQGTLSIGVDEQSNSIVVACSEALFQEIRRLVDTLDVAASTTQRTVSIVTLKNSTPSAVQDALNGLMGITTSRTSTRSGDSSSSRGFGGGFPVFGGGMPFGGGFQGGFPGGGFQGGGFSPFGSSRGGDDRGRSFDFGRGGFPGGGDFGRGGGGDFGRDRRP